ncbi:MAG: tetratricopeptide repeat protein [Planctomycetota bacterium]
MLKKSTLIIFSLNLFISSFLFSTVSAGDNFDITKNSAVFINKDPIDIEYNIDKTGLNSINRVILFISDNKGRSWTKYGEDPDLTSPVRFLPVKEGEYYFAVVAYDRAGNDSGLPISGAAQDTAPVYVDFTPPKCVLKSPRGGEFYSGGKKIQIDYQVIDKHLPLNTVKIYASSMGGKEGSWKLIADEQPYRGSYNYTLPEENIENLVFKIEARDMVGLSGSDMTTKAIKVKSDRPVVSVKGVKIPRNKAYSSSKGRKLSSSGGIHEAQTAPVSGKEKTASVRKTKSTLRKSTPSKAAFIAFSMAGNLVRQGRPKDALRYYMTALSADPDFIDAMSDSALIYKALGDYEQSKKMIFRALKIAPQRAYLYHNLAETYHAEGFALLERGKYGEGMELVSQAVKNYGLAIETAERTGNLAERAATFFRLGEVSFFANSDIPGARTYWMKVLSLHSPTPDPLDTDADYQRYTEIKIELKTWKNWALQYIKQLDRMGGPDMPQPQPVRSGNTQGIYMNEKTMQKSGNPDVAVSPTFQPSYFLPFAGKRQKTVKRKTSGPAPDNRYWDWKR